MSMLFEIILWTSTAMVIFIVGSLWYDDYKDREWRRNNPDEHEIMHRKIKDDFSK